MQTQTLSPPVPPKGFSYERAARESDKQTELLRHLQSFKHFSLDFHRPEPFAGTPQDSYEHLVTREFDNRREALRHIRADSLGARWLADAMGELEEIDDEVAEEALPELAAETKKHARRIVFALTKQPIAPTIYPTTDGEVALYFKSPVAASSVLILVGNDGQAACFSYINGKNRRARYDDVADLPDEFVKAQIQALKEPAFP